jgi:hypothetical protein
MEINNMKEISEKVRQEAAIIALELYNLREREKQLTARMQQLAGILECLTPSTTTQSSTP